VEWGEVEWSGAEACMEGAEFRVSSTPWPMGMCGGASMSLGILEDSVDGLVMPPERGGEPERRYML
jgi:hypothetical protein